MEDVEVMKLRCAALLFTESVIHLDRTANPKRHCGINVSSAAETIQYLFVFMVVWTAVQISIFASFLKDKEYEL